MLLVVQEKEFEDYGHNQVIVRSVYLIVPVEGGLPLPMGWHISSSTGNKMIHYLSIVM